MALGRAAVPAAVLFFNHTTYRGFYRFALGWPVLVTWLLVLSKGSSTVSRAETVSLLVTGALLYACHVLWFAVGLAWLTLRQVASRAPMQLVP